MKILVVGAGIAGSAVALMLSRSGHDVTVVDAAPEPPTGGFLLLFDSVAMEVFGQLGATSIAERHSVPTPEISIRINGRRLTSFMWPGARLARRGALIGALSRYVAETVSMTFGRKLTGIEQRLGSVLAHYEDGSHETYDLIVGADGVNSTVRRLVIGPDDGMVYRNGRVHHWIRVPGTLAGTSRATVLLANGVQCQFFPYPDQDATLLATVIHAGDGRLEPAELLQASTDLLRRSGREYAAFIERVNAVDPDSTRITRFTQVRTERWHAPRVVLVGDAAHCIDPLSGLGAHGGLLGAAILTEELSRTPRDIWAASERYTRRTRRFVRPSQLFTAALVEASTGKGIRRYRTVVPDLVRASISYRNVRVPSASYAPHSALRTSVR